MTKYSIDVRLQKNENYVLWVHAPKTCAAPMHFISATCKYVHCGSGHDSTVTNLS